MKRRTPWLIVGVAACACGAQPQPSIAPRAKATAGRDVVIIPAVTDAGTEQQDAAAAEQTKTNEERPPPHVGDVDFAFRQSPPRAFRCDGDAREWGTLVPETVGAPSHAALTFDAGKLFVAGDLASSAHGVWIELVFPHSGFPFPSEYDHGSGSMIPLDCEVVVPPAQVFPKGGRTGFVDYKIGVLASAQPACRRLMKKNDALGDMYELRFRRLYRVDSAGVRWLDGASGLVPVPDGLGGIVRRGNRLQFEMVIPDLALPRAAETPVRSVELNVSDAQASAPPPNVDERRAIVDVGEVRFEPGSAVRELFSDYPMMSPFATIAYSYQPGEGTTFEGVELCNEEGLPSVCHGRGSYVQPGGPALGVVQLHPGDRGHVLAINGKPVQIMQGTVVSRPGTLHVIAQHVSFDDDGGLKFRASWSIRILNAQGQEQQVSLPGLICDPTYAKANCCHPVSSKKRRCEPVPFHNADFTELGIRGRGWREQDGKIVTELRWSWDPAKGEYVSRIPAAAGKP